MTELHTYLFVKINKCLRPAFMVCILGKFNFMLCAVHVFVCVWVDVCVLTSLVCDLRFA